MEERVDERRRMKRLEDCGLPEGFSLEAKRPRQIVMDGQLRWAFVLVWTPAYKVHGLERGGSFYFPQRYELNIPEDVQMKWALDEFTSELTAAGYDSGDVSGFVPEKFEPTMQDRRELQLAPRGKWAASEAAWVC